MRNWHAMHGMLCSKNFLNVNSSKKSKIAKLSKLEFKKG
jgi:hypothetical protein